MAAFLLLIGILSLQVSTLLAVSITGFELGAGQTVRIRTPVAAGSYFILLRGGDLTTVNEPAALGMNPLTSHPEEVELVDGPSALPIAARFYRVEQVPLDTPRDTDGDGMDDVFELRYSPTLNPLDPRDAGGDPDGDGVTSLVEAKQGTNPLVADVVEPPQVLPLPRFAAGNAHTLALRTDGTLWAWGLSQVGQVGDGTSGPLARHPTPVAIQPESRWQSVVAGFSHSVALRADGALWSWGANTKGQLGDGSDANALVPVAIQPATRWLAVAAGFDHTVALRSDGSLWAWGRNDFGQLGDGTTNNRPSPQAILPATRWKAVVAGAYHTLAVRADGTLWAWGNNLSGELGDGTKVGRTTPVPVLPAVHWQAVAAGLGFSLGLQEDGRLWVWGDNSFGQLGDVSADVNRSVPTVIVPEEHWQAVAAGHSHALAVRADGTLWTWGKNNAGQLGVDPLAARNKPTVVLPNSRWVAVAGGAAHSVALREDGSLWACGQNSSGELGDGSRTRATTAREVLPGGALWLPAP
jgi:alpha-tubulin suppressor-like RCC1 family protein